MGPRIPGYAIVIALGCCILCDRDVFAQDSKLQTPEDFLPVPPREQPRLTLPGKLADVPEIHFQQLLTKDVKAADAELHIKRTVDKVHALNQKKTDAFMETLLSKRADLAGLSFAMGDTCRMKVDASRQFAASLTDVRQAHGYLDWNPSNIKEERKDYHRYISKWSAALRNVRLTDSQRELGEMGIRIAHRRLELLDLMEEPKDGGVWPAVAGAGMPGPAIDLMDCFTISQWAKWQEIDPSIQVAVLMQVFGVGNVDSRRTLVKYLDGLAHADATRALAKLAIYCEEPLIREEATRALKLRRYRDYTDVLLAGLKYPWPAVAERASDAIVKLGRTDLVPQLIDTVNGPDPRAPQTKETNGRKVTIVRELVRINHHHNCLLCHTPAASGRANAAPQQTAKLEGLTAQIPVPGQAITAYYAPSNPDLLVRFDVTYLRQDFSLTLPVKDAAPWPDMQRYDFLVRTREVTDREVLAYRQSLRNESPYQRAALSALRQLTHGN